MNRLSLRSLVLLSALTGACGSDPPTSPATDMAVVINDLTVVTPGADLATPPRDMTFVPAKLTFTCATAQVTAATVYSSIITPSCSGNGCHAGNGGNQPPVFGANSTTLIAAVVGKASGPGMNYVTANDVDNSYLLYKVFNQQDKVQFGGGSQMPAAAPLTTANMCLLVNWVRSGAK